MKKLIFLLIILFIGPNIIAQKLEVSDNLKLETAADYTATEALLLESMEWVQENPVTLNPAKRKELNSFIIRWITGTPTISITLEADLTPVDCGECLVVFLSGWTKYSLENNYSKDNIEGALAGAERTIAFYEKNKAVLGKNATIEKWIKQQKKGKLRQYVEGKFK